MAKAIFISTDYWLCVFDLLTPFRLGLGIALVSHRFDCYVVEYFKTRKWTLEYIRIGSKIEENGTNEMEITNDNRKTLPIPKMQLPNKFHRQHCDRFSSPFSPNFRLLSNNLFISTTSDRILPLILHNIWPIIKKNICALELYAKFFRRLVNSSRQFSTIFHPFALSLSMPPISSPFPCDYSAMASDGQAVAKWLFTPLQNNVPKVIKCGFDGGRDWPSKTAALKAAFTNASSPVNFIVVLCFS
ncbi:hypothetical protein niasHT_031163 [Heterodera trifolii]|uniref:Uncharacterized protein n=1 Tax=Heterodera trifolii TaxID=157864 RepID=A0ABD2I7P1_9BILA